MAATAYAESTIQTAVRRILDYNDTVSSITGLEDVSTQSIDTIIASHILSGARQAVMIAPKDMLDYSSATFSSGAVNIPSDYLRFGYVSDTAWKHEVGWYCGANDPQYEQQFSDFDGIKASAKHPIVVRLGSYFKCFPTSSTAVMHYSYAPTSSTTSDKTSYNIQTRLYDATLYIIAALVCETLKDTDKSNQMMQFAKNLLSNTDEQENDKLLSNT